MSNYKETAERLERKFKHMRENQAEVAGRAVNMAEFLGGVGAAAAYRAWLAKNSKTMPKIGGLDADTVAGGVLVLLSFLEVIPEQYASHTLYLGAGVLSGSFANKVAGMVNPSQATKGFFNSGEAAGELPAGAGAGDVSANRGAEILRIMRNQALQATFGARCVTSSRSEVAA